jgi:hypothetical protein
VGVNIVGGGGTANYPEGSINTDLIAALTIPGFDYNYGIRLFRCKELPEGNIYKSVRGIGGSVFRTINFVWSLCKHRQK